MSDIIKASVSRIATVLTIAALVTGALLWVTPLLSNAMGYRDDKATIQRNISDHETRLIKLEESRLNMMETIRRVESNTERILDRIDRHIIQESK